MKSLKQILESLYFALNALSVNKMRTLLSLLGITIGIFAMISVFTVIDSMEKKIKTSIESLGENVVYIQKWPWEFGEEYPWWKYMNRPVPSIKEVDEIKKLSNFADATSFMVSTMKSVEYRNNSIKDVTIIAVTHDYEHIRSFEIENGRYFSVFESNNGKNIAIIGNQVANLLFGTINPIDKEIKIAGYKIKVIGVFKKEGEDLFNNSADNLIMLPVNYIRNIVDIRNESLNPFIMVKAKEGISTNSLVDELKGIMRSIRRIKPSEEDNFALNRTSLLTKGMKDLFRVIDIAGLIIGGFSILVGGFGIANIMFVSVKERTNIIGIQKSLGAKNYFILFQFLFESVILCIIGGLIGLLLIYLGTLIVTNWLDFSISLSIWNVVSGILISALIGLISGIAPALSASKLNPVVAINSGI